MASFGLRLPRRDPEPRADQAGGDEVLAGLRAIVSAGDASGALGRLRGFAGEDLSALVRGIADLSDLDGELTVMAARAPDDPLPRLLLGARAVNRAWAARGSGRASTVSREGFDQFHALLAEAEEHLYAAARLDRRSAAPWHFLLVSGRGLEVGPAVSLRRFEAVLARDPAHFGAHRQRLQQLCKKWGGSHEEMHAFARDAMLGSSDPRIGILVAEAHIENWQSLGGGTAGKAYMREPAVCQSLAEAADRSIGHPGYAPARDPYLGHNMFAFAFTVSGQLPAGRRAFAGTRGVVTKAPWEYVKGPSVERFTQWRDTCNKGG
jgi:hypothetical protein